MIYFILLIMVLPLIIGGIMLGYFLLKENKPEVKPKSKPDWINPEIVKQHDKWLKHKDEEELNKIDIKKMKEKDLVKKIKNGSKNWKEWRFNETNEKYYQEIERRNQEIEIPKLEKVGKVFRDDPNAISMMKKKLENKEKMVLYWKKIIKFPARDYGINIRGSLGDERWFALTSASTEVREAKKKLAKLESDKKSGVKLERKNTFTTGKKRFYYKKSS